MNAKTSLRAIALSGVLALAGCITETAPPADLDLSSSRATNRNTYSVEIKPMQSPLVINKMHAWQVEVKGPDGKPVRNAKIAVDGGMPQHAHGFPTQPRITKEVGEGRYLLEGMKFSMPGWWEIKLDITSAQGSDQVTFNTVIPVNAGKI